MANVISCPKCERQLRVPDELLGQSVKCPSCNETFTATAAPGEKPSSFSGSSSPRPRDEDEDRPSRRRAANRDDDEDDDRGSRRRLTPHRGDMIQILGILAFIPVFGLPFILGPIAWIMGNGDLREMDAGRMDPAGRKATETGRMCGKIALIVYASIFLLTMGTIVAIYGSICCCAVGAGAGGAR